MNIFIYYDMSNIEKRFFFIGLHLMNETIEEMILNLKRNDIYCLWHIQ